MPPKKSKNPTSDSSVTESSNRSQEIDLFSAFFRTKPCALTTVLPNSLLYSLQESFLKSDDTANATSKDAVRDKTDYDFSPSNLDPHFKRNGIEYVRESGKFRFLASNIAENFQDRAPLTVDALKSASKLIKQNAAVEIKRRAEITRKNQRVIERQKRKKEAKKETKN